MDDKQKIVSSMKKLFGNLFEKFVIYKYCQQL